MDLKLRDILVLFIIGSDYFFHLLLVFAAKPEILVMWVDKMVEEGRIAVPPGGTLEKGSIISMFFRLLIHNAMEEQMRQEALEAEDDDDDDDDD